MEFMSVFFAVIIGFFLVIGDHLAISVGLSKSRNFGLACWLGFVALPIAVMAFVNFHLLFVALPVSAVLSGILFVKRRSGNLADEFEG